MLNCNSEGKPRSLLERGGDPMISWLRDLRVNIKLTEFLTVEDSLQFAEGCFNNF